MTFLRFSPGTSVAPMSKDGIPGWNSLIVRLHLVCREEVVFLQQRTGKQRSRGISTKSQISLRTAKAKRRACMEDIRDAIRDWLGSCDSLA